MPKKYTTAEFIEKAKEIHAGRFSYEETVYTSSTSPIIITCPLHGNFQQAPVEHLVGKGCQKCATENRSKKNAIRSKKQRLTQEEFLNRSREIHGYRYDYTKVIFEGIRKYIIIICPEHGEFSQMAQAHIYNKQGCPACFKDLRKPKPKIKKDRRKAVIESNKRRKRTTEQVVEQLNKIHNNKYKYEFKYESINQKIKIICPVHGDFVQNFKDHFSGNGCQKCANFSTSFLEQQWLDSLGIPEECRQIIVETNEKNFKVDGYIAETNTVYEFFGDFWHGNPKNSKYPHTKKNPRCKKTFGELYKETTDRLDCLEKAGYNIVYVWEKDWLDEQNNIQKR